MGDKLYSSEVTAIKKLRGDKLSAKEKQKRNKEIFDKSYFGSEYVNTWKWNKN